MKQERALVDNYVHIVHHTTKIMVYAPDAVMDTIKNVLKNIVIFIVIPVVGVGYQATKL
ncbi:MAG: hypothetical protein GWP19_14335 [Planctomycetia bacterium]|nr:hypothetical protein [Planctomycetia bacterium]